MTLLILRVIETSFSTATQQVYNNRYIHIMPKAKAPKKSGSIMSYFEPVKLPRKLAKLENQDQTTRSAAAAKKTKLKPTPQDEIPSVLNWVLTDTLLKTQYKAENIPAVPARLAVAAFDLDSTLVDTKSRTPFPRNGSDWRWLNDRVKPSLIKLAQYTKNDTHMQDLQSNQKIPLEENQKTQAGLSQEKPDQVQKEERPLLSEQKPTKDQTQDQEEFQLSEQFSVFLANATQSNLQYIIVIFSNQGGVVTKPDAKRYCYLKDRVEQIALDLGAPFWFYAATKEPKALPAGQVSFRKPATGMWMHFQKEFEQDGARELDFENSFFVGDAAGRPKDFSDSDLKFATSLGLKFYTPEEFF